jgi:hypothetical protein
MLKRIGLLCLFAVACDPLAEGTVALPGEEKTFDVIASYDKIAAHAGQEAKLIKFEASYVQTNGLMDLTQEYRPRATFEFAVKASKQDADAQGPRAPGSGFVIGDLISSRVEVRAPYYASVSSGGKKWTERHLGMDRDTGGPASKSDTYAEPPKCSFAQLWKEAIAKGAPSDVVAIIRYDSKGYTFKANGRDFEIFFDKDCSASSNQDPTSRPD